MANLTVKDIEAEALKYTLDKEFEISMLFANTNPNLWEAETAEDRRELGREFKKLVEADKVKGVIYIRTESNKHNWYKRKKK